MEKVKGAIKAACRQLFDADVEPVVTRPDEQFGDYATNVALQIAPKVSEPAKEIAKKIAQQLEKENFIERAEPAGPGFINIWLNNEDLTESINNAAEPHKTFKGQQILTEFGDPNPLKAMHLGHLYTAIVGDAIAHLFEAAGAEVKRLSYHGDVGMHIAKCIWAVLRELNKSKVDSRAFTETLTDIKIGAYYAEGSKAYDQTEEQAEEIKQVNEHVYKRDDELINQIYDSLVKKSFAIFDEIFKELNVSYDKRYLESQSAEAGVKLVNQNIGDVFEKSEGAIVYKGEKAGLHTRVFINSRGLPTYEAKDLGLAELKHADYPDAKQSIVITANEQSEYFRVMLAALKEIDPEIAQKTRHVSHGFVSLTTGKMSSRTGDIFGASTLLTQVKETVQKLYPKSRVNESVYLAAVKYTFLKQRIGGDIVFDVNQSISLDGNSGPYIQYAHARARSILAKSSNKSQGEGHYEPDERSLARKISEYPEVVEIAVKELMPHHICTYLYELAQIFNRFYENHRVIGDEREAVRLELINKYAEVLKKGLDLLNIPAPDKM